ncbi:ABC transporter ATP-binding protein [Bosea sp. 685]|uniref:ABC transporter ATP-binding protein n=1 Tax=Bosea sp. 685 TaxID=3080057 RepID=UPI002892E3B8|nr:ABC transporter ATP-binding protein [Bosea sp. 685]WNJ90357.1 ABC transporter ATP-binding protein [Bosea sp. 685]
MSAPALQTIGLVKRFGGIVATNDVSLTIERGARHALIGPNGAGKTTLVNQLTGVLKPSEGRILLEGRDITTAKPEARVRLGMSRTFQINQLFQSMTPLDMLLLVLCEQQHVGLKLWQKLDKSGDLAREAAAIAERFRLDDVIEERIATLPYGKQRQLEIAAAFAARPRLLLLDEPAAGVPEAERRDLLATVADLPADVSVLLIEHDMDLVFRFATRITVLVNGTVIAEGTPSAIAADPAVRAAYLGESLDA